MFKSEYSPVSQEDDTERALLGQSSAYSRVRKLWHCLVPYVAHAAVLGLFSMLLVLFLRPSDARCRAQLSPYSPALEAVEYHEVYFNGSLTHSSPYRGDPNPAVDDAWDRLYSDVKPTRLTRDMLIKIGAKDRPSLVEYPDEDGGYMGSLEVFHQLHCVNMLRKFSYREYYEPRKDEMFQVEPELLRHHIDHCLEMLRQNIMCNADVAVITYDWADGHNSPYPDFDTLHKCRDYGKIVDWSYAHAVHIPRSQMHRPEDVDSIHEH